MQEKKEVPAHTLMLQHTVLVLQVVGPPVLLFLLLLADTYGTAAGIAVGLIEANPIVSHFNEKGVTGQDLYHRFLTATISATVFLFAEVAARLGLRPAAFWYFLQFTFWTVLLGEAFVVLTNNIQMATVLNAP